MKRCSSRRPRRRAHVQIRAGDGALSRFFITLLAWRCLERLRQFFLCALCVLCGVVVLNRPHQRGQRRPAIGMDLGAVHPRA